MYPWDVNGVQECPTSGVLWAEAISMAPRPQRKSKSSDALKRCNDDPHIIAAVATLFKNDGKVSRLIAAIRTSDIHPAAQHGLRQR